MENADFPTTDTTAASTTTTRPMGERAGEQVEKAPAHDHDHDGMSEEVRRLGASKQPHPFERAGV